MRKFSAGRAAADRSASAYEAAYACRAPAITSAPALTPIFATAPQNKKTEEMALRSFTF